MRTADVSWREWGRAAGGLALLTGASTVLMGTLPLLNGLFANHLHLDWQQLGWLGGVAQAGSLARLKSSAGMCRYLRPFMGALDPADRIARANS